MDPLTAFELKVLQNALGAPPLWALSVVLGELGQAATLDVLRTRELPAPVRERLADALWSERDLPTADTFEKLLLGCRLAAVRGPHRTKLTPREAAQALGGVELSEAVAARDVLERYLALSPSRP